MNEKLIIRVGQDSNDKISWLIWSDKEADTIASGELDNAVMLSDLVEKTQRRNVVLLLPASKVQLKQVSLPAKWSRKLINALPFMLEEDIASDIDEVVICHGQAQSHDGNHSINVAITEVEWFEQWLTIFKQLEITIDQVLPDALLLPNVADEKISAIQLGENWLMRQGQWQIAEVEPTWLPLYLQGCQDKALVHFSPCEFENIELEHDLSSYDLPLAVFAKQLNNEPFTMLQGSYAPVKKSSTQWLTWRAPAIAASIALVFSLSLKGYQLYQLDSQVAATKAEVVATYKKAFPNQKVRPHLLRSQLKKKVAALEQGGEGGFLALLETLSPTFKSVEGFQPESVRFDVKRGEIRLRASAKDFQSFNKVKQSLEAMALSVEQGSLNNADDVVVGELKIKGKV